MTTTETAPVLRFITAGSVDDGKSTLIGRLLYEYTRNMVTGASTADAAIILIDATRVDFNGEEPALLPQTKRHSAILKLLGTPHIIVAVNKLDLLGFDRAAYEKIVSAYRKLAAQIGLNADIRFIPISALGGDNIVNPSADTPWYQGEPLLPLLENLPATQSKTEHQPA